MQVQYFIVGFLLGVLFTLSLGIYAYATIANTKRGVA